MLLLLLPVIVLDSILLIVLIICSIVDLHVVALATASLVLGLSRIFSVVVTLLELLHSLCLLVAVDRVALVLVLVPRGRLWLSAKVALVVRPPCLLMLLVLVVVS